MDLKEIKETENTQEPHGDKGFTGRRRPKGPIGETWDLGCKGPIGD